MNFKLFLKTNQTATKEFVSLFNQSVNAQPNPMNPRTYYIHDTEDDSLIMYSIKAFPTDVYISDLTSDPRGFPAIKFLKKLTNMADLHQITLTCISQPLDVNNKVDPVRLTNLYKKFGFKTKSPNSDNLVRLPK